MAWIGAFVVGICMGLFGSGGSILNIPILIYVVGEEEKTAIAESLAIVGLVALVAAFPYARKRLVVWRSVVLFGGPGMVGAYLGAALAEFVPAAAQLTLLAMIMLLAAFMMLRPPKLQGNGTPRAYWKIASDGLLVGIFTGLVGVGGGFLIVPTLVLLGGLTMHEAVGTSLMVIALKSFSGYVKYHDVLQTLGFTIHWDLIWIFTALGIAGSFAGSFVAHRIPQRTLQWMFALALVLLAVYMAGRNLPVLLAAAPTPV